MSVQSATTTIAVNTVRTGLEPKSNPSELAGNLKNQVDLGLGMKDVQMILGEVQSTLSKYNPLAALDTLMGGMALGGEVADNLKAIDNKADGQRAMELKFLGDVARLFNEKGLGNDPTAAKMFADITRTLKSSDPSQQQLGELMGAVRGAIGQVDTNTPGGVPLNEITRIGNMQVKNALDDIAANAPAADSGGPSAKAKMLAAAFKNVIESLANDKDGLTRADIAEVMSRVGNLLRLLGLPTGQNNGTAGGVVQPGASNGTGTPGAVTTFPTSNGSTDLSFGQGSGTTLNGLTGPFALAQNNLQQLYGTTDPNSMAFYNQLGTSLASAYANITQPGKAEKNSSTNSAVGATA
jgi:hypothetical protein